MAFNITEFSSAFKGGIRPSQFKIVLTPPAALAVATDTGTGGTIMNQITMMCHATSAPPMIQDSVRVYYFGRPIKVSGDRDFPDWTVSIYNDDNFAVRNFLEQWQNAQNTMEGNLMTQAAMPDQYKAQATVVQYDRAGNVVKGYMMVGIWPTNIDAMQLGWDAVNQIQTFDCTFAYDYWIPDTSYAGPDGAAFDPNAQ